MKQEEKEGKRGVSRVTITSMMDVMTLSHVLSLFYVYIFSKVGIFLSVKYKVAIQLLSK